ncbi:MAG TPA: tetratricopeptide repeat protein [Bryobacteraceae bacterium]|nr:tetratricopeptide repeat protein [Bryobacteraceae bacterium]
MLLGSEDADYTAQAASEALEALEHSEMDGHCLGRLPHKARDLFLANWFAYLCGSFHYEVRTRQEIANIYLATSVAELKEGMKVLLERVQPPQPPSTYTLPDLGHFIGRDAEREEAVARWLSAGHQPLLIQGESGIGKSTLALAVLHHADVRERFGARRYQIRCDALESAAHLKAEMGRRWFGLEPGARIAEQVLARLEEAPAALVVDNLESMLRKNDATESEEWLRSLLGLKTVWLIATLLAHEQPGGMRWSKPAEPKRLSPEAARELFCVIAGEEHRRDPRLDRLLADQQGVPRAIELLAHQTGGAPDLSLLAARWESSGTLVLQRLGGKDRETSLARSYELAMEGVDEGARRLLGVLACLSAGLRHEDIPSITETINETTQLDAAAALERTTLAYFETGRLRLLTNLRDYLRRKHPASANEAELPRDFFQRMALQGEKVGEAGGQEAVALLSENFPNVAWAIAASLDAGNVAAIPAASALAEFSRFSGLGDANLLIRAAGLAARGGDLMGQANCTRRLGLMALARSDHEQAELRYGEALALHRQAGDVRGEASCIEGLGHIALGRLNYEQAGQRYEEALPLFRQVSGVVGEANCVKGLGEIALARSDHEQAQQRFEKALPLYWEVGHLLGVANCIQRLGDIALERSNHEQARQVYEEAWPLYRQVGSVLGEAHCIRRLGDIALRRSDHEQARQRYEEAWPLYRQVGDVLGEAHCIQRLGDIALERSNHE